MKYDILQSTSPADLAEQVQKRIDAGWRPAGGLAVSVIKQRDKYDNVYDEHWYAQAITHAPSEAEPL